MITVNDIRLRTIASMRPADYMYTSHQQSTITRERAWPCTRNARGTRWFLVDWRASLRHSGPLRTAFAAQPNSTEPRYIHKPRDSGKTRLRYSRIAHWSLFSSPIIDNSYTRDSQSYQASDTSGTQMTMQQHHLAVTLTEQVARRSLE